MGLSNCNLDSNHQIVVAEQNVQILYVLKLGVIVLIILKVCHCYYLHMDQLL